MTKETKHLPVDPNWVSLETLGPEARVQSDGHLSLKLWLRLLSLHLEIKGEIKNRLRSHFSISLARFDYMAQLHRHPGGLRMSALSRYLMVTDGNITGLTDELEKEGWVQRQSDPKDRRSWLLHLTPQGRTRFESMAQAHEDWVIELFASMPAPEQKTLQLLLGDLRQSLVQQRLSQSTEAASKDKAKSSAQVPDVKQHPKKREKRVQRVQGERVQGTKRTHGTTSKKATV